MLTDIIVRALVRKMDRIKSNIRDTLVGITLGLLVLTSVYVSLSVYTWLVHSMVPRKMLRRSITEIGTGTKESQYMLKDVGADPVFSKHSYFGHNLLETILPDIIELDYKPIDIVEGMSKVDEQDALVAITLQRQIICPDWDIYGLKTDGGWPVCKAASITPRPPCTVYSFGIKYDWSFDDAYQTAHGCTIRTFDPSMAETPEHEHSPGVFFYPIGISDRTEIDEQGWSLDTYGNLLKRFKEENMTIPYLKFDIEVMEWKVLASMLEEGSLKNVVQLSFEVHVDSPAYARQYFNLIKTLESLGFRRWFYHHRLNGFSYQCDQAFVNMNFVK